MGITSRCNGCGATSLNGVLQHMSSCLAVKPPIEHGVLMPSITMTFDKPEDQQGFMSGLLAGTSGTARAVDSTETRDKLLALSGWPPEVVDDLEALLGMFQQYFMVEVYNISCGILCDWRAKARGSYCDADTPKQALQLLAVALFENGVLRKEETES